MAYLWPDPMEEKPNIWWFLEWGEDSTACWGEGTGEK